MSSSPDVEQLRAFICYSKTDSDLVDGVYRKLTKAGADTWLDMHSLVLGDDWESEIHEAISSADVFVACLSPDFHDPGFRQQEINWALKAAQQKPPGQPFIIPFVVRTCALPQWCKKYHAGGDPAEPSTLLELLKALKKHFGQKFYPEQFLNETDLDNLEWLADQIAELGKDRNERAIEVLLYRLAHMPIQEERDVHDAVCDALVRFGVMAPGGPGTYHILEREKLLPDALAQVESLGRFIPFGYFDRWTQRGETIPHPKA